MKKLAVALFAIAMANACLAGVFNLTALSRANCIVMGANESVTWEAGGQWEMVTYSSQLHPVHGHRDFESTFPYQGWRAYAGCFFCGLSGWDVLGFHYVSANIEDGFDEDRDEWLSDNCTSGSYLSSGSVFTDLCWVTDATGCNPGSW